MLALTLVAAGCSSSDALPDYLDDRYQRTGSGNGTSEYRAVLPVASVDRTLSNKFEPLEAIRTNDGSFLRFDDNRYAAILPAAAGSTVLYGPRPSRAYDEFSDHGGSAAAVRGGGPGEGK